MPAMFRRLLRLIWAAASVVALWLCFLLCVAAPAAWADSHWRETAVQYRARTQVAGGVHDRTYRLMSHDGRVGLLVRQTRVRGLIVLLFLFAEPMEAPSEWRFERFRWDGIPNEYYPPTHAEDGSEWVERRGLGFMYVHQGTAPIVQDDSRFDVQGWGKYWAVPYWAVLAAALPLPLWRLRKWHRRRRRMRTGLCPRCGYDLRATPGRCPECGATAAV